MYFDYIYVTQIMDKNKNKGEYCTSYFGVSGNVVVNHHIYRWNI